MDIDPNKGGWLSRITKTVTSTVKEIGSILTSDDDTPPTTQSNNPQGTGYMAQFDAVLNKELHPNQQQQQQQYNAMSPTSQYPPYDPHHPPNTQTPIQPTYGYEQQQQAYGTQPQQPYTQTGYEQQQQQQSYPTPVATNPTDPAAYPPYMYASLQTPNTQPQPQAVTPSYPSLPTPSFPSQTPSSTYTSTPSTPITSPPPPTFLPYTPQPVISPAVSPSSHTQPSISTSTPYLQPPFTSIPTVTSPSHAQTQQQQPIYSGYQRPTAYPEQPAYLDYTSQQTNPYAQEYQAQATPGYQPSQQQYTQQQQQQQQAQGLPPPPVSNYWKERAAVAPVVPQEIATPLQPTRVDYSDLDPRSMDFVYSDRKYD